MRSMKYIALFCLIAILAVSGCGRKEEEGGKAVTVKMPQSVATEVPAKPAPVTAEKTAGGPVVKTGTPMVEPAKDIVLAEGEILIADFEGWPNNLGGETGVYGSLEPDWDKKLTTPYSWMYEAITPGYTPKNVHNGKQSFRLVNGLGAKPAETWGSFAMDLGPTIDLTVVPKKVESLDVSGYKYLTFWAKGEKGAEKMQLLIRDAHALNYMPQVKYSLPDLTTEWQKVVVPLEEICRQVDLTGLDNVGLAFGKDVGNMEGDIAYIDDFVFTNNP